MSLPAPFASKDSVTPAKPSIFQWLDRFWNPVAILAWTVALSAIIGKILASPDRVTNVNRYLKAGRAWIEGSPLYIYTPNKGFVYGPFSAVCYAVASYLPDVWPRILWCLLSAALLLGGMWAMMTSGPFSQLPARRRGLAFLLVLPLALGNFDSAQANAFLAGLIMVAFAAASSNGGRSQRSPSQWRFIGRFIRWSQACCSFFYFPAASRGSSSWQSSSSD